jgi:hypothetical protein
LAEKSFEEIWNRIIASQGKTFHTIKDLPFTYRIRGNALIPDRTGYQISKKDFERALKMVPISGPGKINYLVRGPAYVWAILHDQRISQGEWSKPSDKVVVDKMQRR